MNNYINDLKIKEISSQLNRAETQKHKLIKNIFKGYEAYLKLVRSLLVASVEKGMHEIYSDYLIKKTNPIYEKLTSIFAKINLDIDSQLPLITIEQLKIRELGGNLIEEKNLENLKMSEESNIYQKGNLVFEEEFNFQETIQFHCNENMFNASEYYHPSINDKACSIDLDISDKSIHDSDSSIKIVEKISLEKRFISSLMELMTEEDDIPDSNNLENLNTSERETFSQNYNLDIFNLIDKSLADLLLNLSYKLNLELIRSNFKKKILSEYSFNYLKDKDFLIKHPYPFVINIELNLKQPGNDRIKKPLTIFLLNITSVELEFNNINLSIQRNKINELKNQYQLLIKKEKYWRQKEIYFNKIQKS